MMTFTMGAERFVTAATTIFLFDYFVVGWFFPPILFLSTLSDTASMAWTRFYLLTVFSSKFNHKALLLK